MTEIKTEAEIVREMQEAVNNDADAIEKEAVETMENATKEPTLEAPKNDEHYEIQKPDVEVQSEQTDEELEVASGEKSIIQSKNDELGEHNDTVAEDKEIRSADLFKDEPEKSVRFLALLDDCEAIVIEHEFNSRWETLLAYHGLGERITEDKEFFDFKDRYGKKIIKHIAEVVKKSEQTVYKAIQFYEMYPDLNALPDGKNLSWYEICKKYLPKPKKVDKPEKEVKPKETEDFDDDIEVTPQDQLQQTLLITVEQLFDIYVFKSASREKVRQLVKNAIGTDTFNEVLDAYNSSDHFKEMANKQEIQNNEDLQDFVDGIVGGFNEDIE